MIHQTASIAAGMRAPRTPRARRIGDAFRAAFPLTVPIAAGFLFLGCSYGLLMHAKGFAIWWPLAMAYFIFAGSMEFVTVNLLLSAFNPFAAFLLALMVNARHLFYGLSMLGRFRGLGWKRPYLIFAMCDESFAINSSARVPDGVDRGWFMLFVSLLNRWYWIGGTALGWLAGGLLPVDTTGIGFVLTALFLVIFLDQWIGAGPAKAWKAHLPALIGVLVTAGCLAVLGPDRFMIPSMALMLVLFLALRPWLDDLRPADGGDGEAADAGAASAAESEGAAGGDADGESHARPGAGGAVVDEDVDKDGMPGDGDLRDDGRASRRDAAVGTADAVVTATGGAMPQMEARA